MTPYEIMLSESQERMLVVLKPETMDTAQAIFDKWDVILRLSVRSLTPANWC